MINDYECDVLVCGAGSAGCCAAIAAARNGVSTIVVEESDIIGGTIVQSLVYPLMTFHAAPNLQVIKGIPEEIVGTAVREGSQGHIPDPLGCAPTITMIEPEQFSSCVYQKMMQAGVIIINNTKVVNIIRDEQAIIGVIAHTDDNQIVSINAKVVIDATGDADIACLAGVPYVYGRISDNKTQPMTLIFTMRNVNNNVVRQYIKDNPTEFVLSHEARNNIVEVPYLAVSGFFRLVREAQQKEGLVSFRDRVLYFETAQKGEVSVNMTRIFDMDGSNENEVEKARGTALLQVQECYRLFKHYIPGFEDAYIHTIAPKIGVRETRHIVGKYTLSAQDVLSGRKFDDGVACGAFPIDIHSPDGSAINMQKMPQGTYYTIPYRCLIPENIESLIVAGRSISATHEASASARLAPTCMALGEAAGTAAAVSVRKNTRISLLDSSEIRQELIGQGVFL
ncbi:MAG: FAD-dependent oxidoreductase [Candidatus Margulisiibacteriota bacterium]|nr:MAG: hypothetical protein A2X43_09535 [Candidatus Margulisbacteria bacterium GWD2_39_127]OGI02869.1 MAG: hypothetical protein A2X42_02230 [Candidatus Margulisbacteria bacterium GWF2_38_17]OGI09650.1 MAG: hypothetical protein A2X41_04940 [Candidatus Margulisbacteria bacterium GWE2_39_32]PZM83024.1 MAG: FAD-dependent oxidoreductase [Candidatus Margulisiibacteriota bacterium]HAR62184.1 FAD-dependent oxidoreductase [Candidatus Margulisiibacteriota bacterium]